MAVGGHFLSDSKFEGFDNDGAPLSAGKLWSWLSGSSRATLKATYTDTTLGTPNANPLTLDGNGRATVVMESGVYELELRDAAGAVIWTIDGYQGSANPWNVLVKSGNYTVLATDGPNALILVDASSTSPTTIAPYTAVGHRGDQILVIKTDTTNNGLRIDPAGGETVNGDALVTHAGRWASFHLVSDGANWIDVGRSGMRRALFVSGTYTVTDGDRNSVILADGTFTINLPTTIGRVGFDIDIKNIGIGTVTLDASGAETIDGATTLALPPQYSAAHLVATNLEWSVVGGQPGRHTWTPTIGGSGGESGQVYSTQVGYYVKRGPLVTVSFNVVLSTLGTITTNVQIKGLPFAAKNLASLQHQGLLRWLNLTTAAIDLKGQIAANASVIDVFIQTGAATSVGTNAVQADLSATTALRGTFTYITEN